MNPNTPPPLNMGKPKPLNFNLTGSQVSTGSQSNQIQTPYQGAFGQSGIPYAPQSTPTTIPVQNTTGQTQALPVPNAPTTSSAASNLTATAGGTIQQPTTTQQPTTGQPQAPTTTQTGETGDYKKDFMNQIDAITELQQSTFADAGLAKKLEESNAARAKYDLLNEQYRVQEERVRTRPGTTVAQANAEIAELERKRAFSAGTLAIEFAAKNQDYTSAKELMNQQLELQLEPMRQKRDFYRDMYMKTEDQRFQRQMRAEERAYQSAKELGEMQNSISIDAMKAGMSQKDAAKFASNPTVIKATARRGVMNAVEWYIKELDKYKGAAGSGGVFDFNRLTAGEKAKLDSALKTTVGSAINVAQGQGAMGDEEAKRILDGLTATRGTRTKVFDMAAQGIIEAQQMLLNSELDLLSFSYGDSVYNMPMFIASLPDEDLVPGANSGMSVPTGEAVYTY